jgi:hypothetical protein
MTERDYRSSSELEDANHDPEALARRRAEQAEEYVCHYRSTMRSMQEGFYAVAAHMGAADDPVFRAALAKVVEESDENIRRAAKVVARLDEDYHETRARHDNGS